LLSISARVNDGAAQRGLRALGEEIARAAYEYYSRLASAPLGRRFED